MNTLRTSFKPWMAIVAAAIITLILPLVLNIYFVHLATGILIFSILSIGLGILTKTGQVSIGQAAFFGIGAYSAAIINKYLGTNLILEFGGAMLATAAFSVMLGYVTLRMKGIYFSIATLAFTETMLVFSMMERKVIGGAMGLTVKPLFGGKIVLVYYLALGLASAALLVSWFAYRSKLGYASQVIKNDERLAASIGIDPTRYKITAFVLSAMLSGLAGAFYVHYVTFIVPNEVFNLNVSVSVLAMTIFGGAYSFIGPVIGTVVLKIVEEFLRLNITNGHQIGYGIILIISILFMPDGVVGLWKKSRKSRHASSTTQEGDAV